jgi:glycosyltransferase involved in cell wall biosynthesis
MSKDFEFSVVIPTIGRPSLELAIESVLAQEYSVREIILIVLIGSVSESRVAALLENDRTKIIWIGTRDISKARNLGIEHSSGNWIAFLDDDDLWFQEKLQKQVQYVERMKVDANLTSARLVGRHSHFRPKKCLLVGEPILINVFKAWFNFENSRYLPTPSLIYNKAKFPSVRFDESLSEREDLWFMHALQVAGASFSQSQEVLVEIKSTKPLQNRRVSAEQDLVWAKRLQVIEKSLGKKFLLSTAIRNRIYARDLLGAFKLIKAILVQTI